jgi:hypothetical protein
MYTIWLLNLFIAPIKLANENLAKYSHKTPTWDELVIARVIGLANPGSFR